MDEATSRPRHSREHWIQQLMQGDSEEPISRELAEQLYQKAQEISAEVFGYRVGDVVRYRETILGDPNHRFVVRELNADAQHRLRIEDENKPGYGARVKPEIIVLVERPE